MIQRSKDTPADPQRCPTMHGTTDTRVVDAAGDLRDTRVLQVFHRRCEGTLNPAPRRVVVDLAGVTSADTKLVATLVLLLRRAHSEGVPLDLATPDRVNGWIMLCQVEHLLRPACVPHRVVTHNSGSGNTPRPMGGRPMNGALRLRSCSSGRNGYNRAGGAANAKSEIPNRINVPAPGRRLPELSPARGRRIMDAIVERDAHRLTPSLAFASGRGCRLRVGLQDHPTIPTCGTNSAGGGRPKLTITERAVIVEVDYRLGEHHVSLRFMDLSGGCSTRFYRVGAGC